MEVCSDGSAENDSHIINLMGSSDLNLVDTSMLPTDPRAMMDLVRSEDHDEDGLSSFPSISINNHSSFPCNNNLTYSTTLSPISCSVSLSASAIERPLASPKPTVPPLHGLGAQLIAVSHRPVVSILQQQQLPLASPVVSILQHQQLPLTSPPLPPSHQSPSYHQDVSSSSLDTSRDSHSSQHTPSPLQTMPPAMQTPPLHSQEFQSAYYVNNQISPSKHFQGNSAVYPTNNNYGYTPVSLHQQQQQQQPSPILSPHELHRKREIRSFHVPPLKRDPEEFAYECKSDLALSSPEIDHNDQPPYSAFGHLNITSDEIGIQASGLHRNHGAGSTSTSPLCSPPDNSTNCSMPGESALNSRFIPGYIFSSSAQMVLEMNPNNARLQNQLHLGPLPHQQSVFQPVQLHTPAAPLQGSSLASHQDNLNVLSPQPLSISLSAYEESLHNDPLSSASRNLSFNYSDIIPSPNCQPSSVYQQFPFASKGPCNKEPCRRRSGGTASNVEKGNEENLDNFTSDSDDEALVIDTNNSVEGYECGECKTVCRTRGNLRKHLATEHTSNEPEPAETIFKDYKCTVSGCSYMTKFRNEYDEHVSEHVAQGWTPTGKKRHNKNPLLRHRYNKEEFQCPHCPYSCTVEKAFNRHLCIHENPENSTLFEAAYVSCVICGKDRPSEAALRMHMNKHRKGKKYKCDICNFVTVQLKKLIQHRRMHTGEKPHLCPFCVYRAARRDNLRSHVRRMHKKSNMYGDTFTPRPLIVAQVEASQGGRLQPHLPAQLPLITLGQHSGVHQQIPQHPSHALLERLQQAPQTQPVSHAQLSRAVMMPHQTMGLSNQGLEIISGPELHLPPHHHQAIQGMVTLSQHSPHSSVVAPQDQ